MTSWRRLLAAVLAAAAVGGAAHAATGGSAEEGTPVVVAAREVPVGAMLTDADVTVRRLPPDAVPAGALVRRADAVGLPAAVVLASGEVLTRHDVKVGSLLVGQPEGSVAVWLPVTERAVAEALSSGDRVDVHSPVDGRRVVEAVLVVAARTDGGTSGGGLVGSPASSPDDSGVWLAISAEQAAALAAARGADPAGGALLIALHPVGG